MVIKADNAATPSREEGREPSHRRHGWEGLPLQVAPWRTWGCRRRAASRCTMGLRLSLWMARGAVYLERPLFSEPV